MGPPPEHFLVYMTLGKLAHFSKFRKMSLTYSTLKRHVGA